MADVLRSCTKTGCRWPAAASLSYRYASRQVWLLDLASSPDPSLYDLCPHHADHLVVPKGWERVDDRTAQEVMVEPSASDRADQAARRRWAQVEPPDPSTVAARPRQLVGAASGGNRYAALVEQLPRLAAEAAADGAHAAGRQPGGHLTAARGHSSGWSAPGSEDTDTPSAPVSHLPAPVPQQTEPPTASSPEAMAEPPLTDPRATPEPPPGPLADARRGGPVTGAGRPGVPLPSRELSPLPAEPAPAPPAPPADDPGGPADVPIPGQLAIPVDDLDSGRDAVIVPFELAGSRRRSRG